MFPSHPDEIGDNELERISDILDDAMESQDDLTDWEVNFVDDMREKLVQYGRRTRISERQMEVIDRIDAKLNE